MSRLLRDDLRRRSVSSLLQIALFLEWPDRRAAIALYGMIERRFACSQDLRVQRTGAQAMVNCCLALGKLGRREAGIAICERLIERFGRSSDHELVVHVAWAMVDKGCFLQELGRDREAVDLYEEVARRSAHSPEAAQAYAASRRNMAIALRRLGRGSEAAAISSHLAGLPTGPLDQQVDVSSGRLLPTVVAAAVVLLAASLIGAAVSAAIPPRRSTWLLFPVLFINHQEHGKVMVGTPSGLLLLALIVIMGIVAARYVLHLPFWTRIAFGVVFGGALANAGEYSVAGSVTDFIGIGTLGIWSAGDICVALGLLAMAAGGIARPEALVRGVKRWHLILAVLVLGGAMTVISGSFVWMEWSALACVSGVSGALLMPALSSVRRWASSTSSN